MTASDVKSLPVLGFLTVVEYQPHGLFGGYLVLNALGRPLEFHCTAPVKPNRAQKILYGPTLLPFLYGEQIGQTLVNKAATSPATLCTDVEPVLAIRDFVSLPVALVVSSEESDKALRSDPTELDSASETAFRSKWRVDQPHRQEGDLTHFAIGTNRLAVPASRIEDRGALQQRLAEIGPSFDLSEPFARIREAIAEAQRGSQ